MSDDASSLNAELVADLNAGFISDCIGFATVALLVYEYIITSGVEVDLFWRQKFTGASVLFLVNRHLVLFYNLSLLRSFWPFTEFFGSVTYEFANKSCVQWANGTRAVEILCYLPWAVFSALRVFALSGRNWFLGILVFLLSCAPIGINFADFHWAHVTLDTVWGCSQNVMEPQALSNDFTIISRVCLIVADVVVIAVTWFATYTTTRIAAFGGLGERKSLSVLLLRDGTIYFIALLSMNTMHLAFSTSSVLIGAGGGNISDVILIFEPLTAVLVSRFLINLQETNVNILHQASTQRDESVTLHFDRIIGSLGDSVFLPVETRTNERDNPSENDTADP